jgi:hypothetical protein
MKDFFYLKEGLNKLKLLTQPYQFKYHWHDKQMKICFKSSILHSSGECELCLGQEKLVDFHSHFVGMFIGVQVKDDDKKYIWRIPSPAFRQLQEVSRGQGDPIQFEYDVTKDNLFTHVNKLNSIENIKDEEISKKILQMIDAMWWCLNKKSDPLEFKKFYQACKNHSDQLVDELYSTVEKDFPQKLETLKTLLLFS